MTAAEPTPYVPAESFDAVTAPLALPQHEAPPSHGAELRRVFIGLAADIGLPVGAYYTLHAVGASDTVALLAGTIVSGVRMALVAIRSRRITAFAALMFGVYAIGLAMTFVSGDPRFLLVKESFGTAVVGLGFLLSLLTTRPMVLETLKNVPTVHNRELVARYAAEPGVRRTFHVLTAMWGAGLLADAVVRIPVVYALPISVGVAVSQVLFIAVISALVVTSALITKRAQRAEAAR